MLQDSDYILKDFNAFKSFGFHCMGGACEVLVECQNLEKAKSVFEIVFLESKRIEKKFSRYESSNIIYKINHSLGKKISLDKETAKLIHYADQIYELSDGFFDITSGVLRKAWIFDQSDKIPEKEVVENLLSFVGWNKVKLENKAITLPKNFEIDLGGIGKEYAVDRSISLLRQAYDIPVLVNLGGDIAVTRPKLNSEAWVIKIEDLGFDIQLSFGAVATSGDKNKYINHKGKKLSHILNPKTGWPIQDAPSAITVIDETCTAAGTLSTLALLKSPHHEEFLNDEAKKYYILK